MLRAQRTQRFAAIRGGAASSPRYQYDPAATAFHLALQGLADYNVARTTYAALCSDSCRGLVGSYGHVLSRTRNATLARLLRSKFVSGGEPCFVRADGFSIRGPD